MASQYTNHPEKDLLYPLLVFLIKERVASKGTSRAFPIEMTRLVEFLKPLHLNGNLNIDKKLELLELELEGIAEDLEELFIIKNPEVFAGKDDKIILKFSKLVLLRYYKELKTGDGYREQDASLNDMLADQEQAGPLERVVLKKSKKNIILPELPSGLQWNEVTIRFLNGEQVMINARNLQFDSTAALMGFENEKSKQPDVQWKMLQQLARNGGELNWDNANDLSGANKKRKQLLSEALQTYFRIESDPFEDYRKAKAYRVKFNLVPEQADEGEERDLFGIHDFLSKQNPSIYEGPRRNSG